MYSEKTKTDFKNRLAAVKKDLPWAYAKLFKEKYKSTVRSHLYSVVNGSVIDLVVLKRLEKMFLKPTASQSQGS
jgi:hypothetical protein